MVIERDVDLPLKTAGLVPVRFAVPHKDQAGAFALLWKRLQVCGAVQAFDLDLWPINSGRRLKIDSEVLSPLSRRNPARVLRAG